MKSMFKSSNLGKLDTKTRLSMDGCQLSVVKGGEINLFWARVMTTLDTHHTILYFIRCVDLK